MIYRRHATDSLNVLVRFVALTVFPPYLPVMELPEIFQVGCPLLNILKSLAANSLSFGDDI